MPMQETDLLQMALGLFPPWLGRVVHLILTRSSSISILTFPGSGEFASPSFTGLMETEGVMIGMDSRGKLYDNILF
jgi:hypothetical protein